MIEARRRPWCEAMAYALYGESGFYVTPGAPGRHFRTSAHTSPSWAGAILTLATQVDDALGRPDDFTVVDIGAGGGELLADLAAVAPARWHLIGADLAPRPDGLAGRVAWTTSAPGHFTGVLIANELLDVVPVDVVELTADGLRIVEVSSTGEESIGCAVSPRDAEWLRQWWPLHDVGDRAEVGRRRDDLWRSLTARLDRGLAVAIDYAVDPTRDVAGTLTGYRNGQQVVPMPDGTCDITAHVHFGSLVDAGDVVLTQREALRQLGVRTTRPSYDDDPAAYLAALSKTGDAAELVDPEGLGAFSWLIHSCGVRPRPA